MSFVYPYIGCYDTSVTIKQYDSKDVCIEASGKWCVVPRKVFLEMFDELEMTKDEKLERISKIASEFFYSDGCSYSRFKDTLAEYLLGKKLKLENGTCERYNYFSRLGGSSDGCNKCRLDFINKILKIKE